MAAKGSAGHPALDSEITVTARSWLLETPLPHPHNDPNEPDFEWFIPGGSGPNRQATPGDHLPLDSPVRALWPDHFVGSPELPDVHGGMRALSRGAQDRRQAEGMHRTIIPAELRVPGCSRCGSWGDPADGVLVPVEEPDNLALLPFKLNPYDDDHTQSELARSAWAAEWRAKWKQAQVQLGAARERWFAEHSCPESTPRLDVVDGPFVWERQLVRRIPNGADQTPRGYRGGGGTRCLGGNGETPRPVDRFRPRRLRCCNALQERGRRWPMMGRCG